MRIFVADAFTKERYKGNQAGVALLDAAEAFPADETMTALAAELKHSETAFVKDMGNNNYHIRYFTPVGEVELCGHATIASFTVLRTVAQIKAGEYILHTLAGQLKVRLTSDMVWLEMAVPRRLQQFNPEECKTLYAAYGLSGADGGDLAPEIVSTGLRDILLPVKDKRTLDTAVMDAAQVTKLSQQYDVVGVHMFCPGDDEYTACCRNFAPLYEIPEEAATGTSNGALTYYLKEHGLIPDGKIATFVQGETMGRTSYIYTEIHGEEIMVGGHAVITLECSIFT